MSGRLANKIALVTGASTGIGRAVVLRFAAEGATVIGVARHDNIEKLTTDSGGGALGWRCDVDDAAQVAALIKRIRERYGRLDVVCNNAGIGGKPNTRIHELDVEDFDRVIHTNLRGAFLVLKYSIPLLLASGGGSIVNMASVGSFLASPGSAAYITSKGGMLLLTRTAALEYVKDNIRVNAVCPGVTATEILASSSPEMVRMLTSRSPMGRMVTSEEVASLTLFLASDEASAITGSAYIIDCGRHAG
jgi:NAD(P)-dependent dehydrogenase (short-subunit alcohol dehydrogenase family)